jgi:phage terminase small subunit
VDTSHLFSPYARVVKILKKGAKMKTAGRPPKPTQVLKLQGTYRKSRHGNRLDSDLRTLPTDFVIPEPPEGLHPKAKALWEPWIEGLLVKHVLTEVDFPTIEIGFVHLSQALRYGDMIRSFHTADSLSNDDMEYLKRLEHLFAQSSKCFLEIMSEYGNTPAARAALKVPEPDNGQALDPLEIVLADSR